MKLTKYYGTKWLVVPIFHLKMGKYTKSALIVSLIYRRIKTFSVLSPDNFEGTTLRM